ncbi:MAG: ATPase domain-containing protein [Candidatus Thermoplasmatota archaeon]|nr:ATPase domain-containing protein [Candidatus Thermoplasmatota archaeon]
MKQLTIQMFIDGMPGMNRVLTSDATAPYLTLLTGPPGSMKSSFALSMVSNHLRQSGGFGLYCTVEETVDSLLRASHSLNLDLPQNLQITDFTELRKENEAMDYLKFTRKMIEHFKRERGNAFSVFILDSLGAIYSLTNVDEEMRKRMFGFFDFLRSQNLYTFVITERQAGEHAELEGNEGFLADAILNLGLDRRNGKIVRTMQIEKMRHVRHSMEKQAMEVTEHGVQLLGPLFD